MCCLEQIGEYITVFFFTQKSKFTKHPDKRIKLGCVCVSTCQPIKIINASQIKLKIQNINIHWMVKSVCVFWGFLFV